MKIYYACLMLLSLAIPAFAQDGPPSANDIVAQMQTKLNLTADQLAAVKPIIEKYASQRQELKQSMEDGTADRNSMRSKMKELRDNETQELSQILSADQMGQWKQMMGKGRHRHGQEGGDGPGNNGEGGGGDNGAS